MIKEREGIDIENSEGKGEEEREMRKGERERQWKGVEASGCWQCWREATRENCNPVDRLISLKLY